MIPSRGSALYFNKLTWLTLVSVYRQAAHSGIFGFVEIDETTGGSDGDVEDGDSRIQLVLRNIVDERSADSRHWFNRNNCCARVDRRTQDSIQPAIGAEI